jgi:hypothetical protein
MIFIDVPRAAHPSARCGFILDGGAIMKRERVLRVFLAVPGILFIALIYPLCTYLWRTKGFLKCTIKPSRCFSASSSCSALSLVLRLGVGIAGRAAGPI